MNTKKQGDIGLGAAIAYFTKSGYTVSIPLTDSQDYDLIVDYGFGVLLKVQTKRTTFKQKPSNNYFVSLTVKGGNKTGRGKIKKFDPYKIDLLFILTGDGSAYVIPSKEIKTQTITLYKGYNKYKV